MAIEKFIDELGSDLNKFQVTTEDGSTYEIKLLRKANITQVGTPLNANKLNQLVDAINTNSAKQVKLNNVINNTPEFYAPTSGGTSGQYLKSNGTSAPTWNNFPKGVQQIKIGGNQSGGGIMVYYNDNTQEQLLALKLSLLKDDVGYAKTSDLSKVATTGSYNDLIDKPTITNYYMHNLQIYKSNDFRASFVIINSLSTSFTLDTLPLGKFTCSGTYMGQTPIPIFMIEINSSKIIIHYTVNSTKEYLKTDITSLDDFIYPNS